MTSHEQKTKNYLKKNENKALFVGLRKRLGLPASPLLGGAVSGWRERREIAFTLRMKPLFHLGSSPLAKGVPGQRGFRASPASELGSCGA